MSQSWVGRAYVAPSYVGEHVPGFSFIDVGICRDAHSSVLCDGGPGDLQTIFLITLCLLASNWLLTMGDICGNSMEGGGEDDVSHISSSSQHPSSKRRGLWLQPPGSFAFPALAMFSPTPQPRHPERNHQQQSQKFKQQLCPPLNFQMQVTSPLSFCSPFSYFPFPFFFFLKLLIFA